VPLRNPVPETDNHDVSEATWNEASRRVFVGVQLRSSTMPCNWSSLGVDIRDPALQLSLRRLAHVDGSNPDIRARFAAILPVNNMAITYRTGHARNSNLQNLGVMARDLLVYDIAYLEYNIYSYICGVRPTYYRKLSF